MKRYLTILSIIIISLLLLFTGYHLHPDCPMPSSKVVIRYVTVKDSGSMPPADSVKLKTSLLKLPKRMSALNGRSAAGRLVEKVADIIAGERQIVENGDTDLIEQARLAEGWKEQTSGPCDSIRYITLKSADGEVDVNLKVTGIVESWKIEHQHAASLALGPDQRPAKKWNVLVGGTVLQDLRTTLGAGVALSIKRAQFQVSYDPFRDVKSFSYFIGLR